MAYRGKRSLPDAGDEMFEVFSKWRRLLGIGKRPGTVRDYKRRFHKLARRIAKRELRSEPE